MGTLDKAFIGITVLLIVGALAVAFVMNKPNFGGDFSAPSFNLASADSSPKRSSSSSTKATSVSFDETSDYCGCYTTAYKASDGRTTLSTMFSTGYEKCSRTLGESGAEAWISGWEARESGARSSASCKLSKKSR